MIITVTIVVFIIVLVSVNIFESDTEKVTDTVSVVAGLSATSTCAVILKSFQLAPSTGRLYCTIYD